MINRIFLIVLFPFSCFAQSLEFYAEEHSEDSNFITVSTQLYNNSNDSCLLVLLSPHTILKPDYSNSFSGEQRGESYTLHTSISDSDIENTMKSVIVDKASNLTLKIKIEKRKISTSRLKIIFNYFKISYSQVSKLESLNYLEIKKKIQKNILTETFFIQLIDDSLQVK